MRNTRIGLILLVAIMGCSFAWLAADARACAPPQRGSKKGPEKRRPDPQQEGDLAVDFQLQSLDGKSKVRLSDYRGRRPVALIFGSYT